MKFESMLLQMKDRMPERRFIHTRGVAETATQLAAKYGEDIEKAEIAGILHDSVKYAEKSWLKEIIISEQMDP
ncbi:MAG: HD domain-containing protein, partial [Psychrobacillus sp.]